MSGENDPVERQEPRSLPPVGILLVDAHNRVGEFRGEWCGLWSLRPVTGGIEWTVAPEDVRPASPEQRMRAETRRANARSRGECL
ncbi:hypothetical protein [Streptantibioticus cattleyicolor]|uniref:Uncharacterized protein n=1 Tax=Streptantibioticus cattleyicolor (strain ATCC 35852 / DSM 46488 / JCM 4925 / NBRC 14057 / NRRL 8057) TaxID=1003195 RepID=F8JJ54_STREN|nr:hypothetical protein [Streptantibioticus cattleyicolor]AEW98855.1 hypothetical protein SCATT_p06620 [Streptantibioticus cattleyicolor NRRL 8057 = DSM 46488]CCB72101.1 conserved protein of unknown function [Streptantibioticus cattleyicolor NRRL 8057 = DSM 46488]